MEKVIGLITCNYSAKSPSALVESRPVASMPFLGRYRLVDFPLSNMVNAGLRTVGMVMPYNYRSIIDHVGSGKDWNLDRKNGGLFVLPGSAFGTSRTGARFLLRDLVHNKVFFTRSKSDYVIFSTANFVYNMDLNELYDAHVASGADVTVLTKQASGNDADVTGFELDGSRVNGVKHGVSFGDTAFLDCFVISRQLLLDMFDWYAATDYLDLFEAMANDYGRVNVQAYNFDGYAAAVFNKKSYYRSNMASPRAASSRPRRTTRRPPSLRWVPTSLTRSSPLVAASLVTLATRSWAATSLLRAALPSAAPW